MSIVGQQRGLGFHPHSETHIDKATIILSISTYDADGKKENFGRFSVCNKML
jgi:hypothetical protein